MTNVPANRVAKRRSNRYPLDFRRMALEKLNSGQYSLRRLSAELGVSVVTLMNWRRADPTEHFPKQAVQVPAANGLSEVESLRAEIAELKRERDRLRNGIAVLIGMKD